MKKKNGFSLIELLLATVVLAIASGAFFTLYFTISSGSANEKNQQQAIFYAQEGLEIVKNLKSGNYLRLNDGVYGLSRTGADYLLESNLTETVAGFFQRRITVEAVYRNNLGQIEENGALLDPATKKITVRVAWNEGAEKNVILQEYLADWEGTTWTQTTVADFAQGTTVNTQVLPSDSSVIADNGQITLATSLNQLSYSETINVLERAKGIFYQNDIIYVAVKREQGGLCTVDFQDPQNPILLDCADIDQKGNDVIVVGNIAYVGMDDDDGLAIVDVANPTDLRVLAILETDDNVDALDIQGNHVYMAVKDNKKGLVIANVSNPNQPFVSARVSTGDNGTGINITGSMAYLLADNELRIYNIANVNNPALLGTLSLPDTGEGVVVAGDYAYVIGGPGVSNTLHIVNVTDPQAPFLAANHDLGASGEAVAIQSGILYVAVNDNASGLRSFSLNDGLNITPRETVNIQGKGQDVFATEGFVFLAVDTAQQGVAVVKINSEELATGGEYLSKIHDSGANNTLYKSIGWLADNPPGTTLRLQLRSAALAEEIGNAVFVGPDGSINSYYTQFPAEIVLDPNRSGSRFLQWKAYFSGDGLSGAALEELTVKYE